MMNCHWIRRSAIPEGVTIDSELDQASQMSVSAMPARCEDFPVSLPKLAFVGYEHFAKRPVLSVEIEVQPALYRPDDDEDEQRTWKRSTYAGADVRLREFDVGRFCETLALVTDNYVGWLARWEDLGDLEAFMLGGSGQLGSNPESDSRPVPIAQAHLNDAAAVYARRASVKEIDIAVSRWVKSKRRDALEDRLIDLRIALEATYSRGIRQELRFRTALNGAVHSGRTPAERKQYFNILKSAYDQASRVVHGEAPKNEVETGKCLGLAQDICRRSLLRIIGEGVFRSGRTGSLTSVRFSQGIETGRCAVVPACRSMGSRPRASSKRGRVWANCVLHGRRIEIFSFGSIADRDSAGGLRTGSKTPSEVNGTVATGAPCGAERSWKPGRTTSPIKTRGWIEFMDEIQG